MGTGVTPPLYPPETLFFVKGTVLLTLFFNPRAFLKPVEPVIFKAGGYTFVPCFDVVKRTVPLTLFSQNCIVVVYDFKGKSSTD